MVKKKNQKGKSNRAQVRLDEVQKQLSSVAADEPGHKNHTDKATNSGW